MGKKRKADGDLEAEKTLQNSFVTAANSISQLFTLAVQQNKRSRTEGTVDALVRPGLPCACSLARGSVLCEFKLTVLCVLRRSEPWSGC